MEKDNQEYKLDMVSVKLVHDTPLLSTHKICTPEDAVEVMGEFLSEMDREVMCVINLKSDGTPINGHIASMGGIDQAVAYPRELLKTAILSNAASMILLHSHPSGSVTPSRADIAVTERMIEIGHLMGIPLMDHIIVGGNTQNYFSFRKKQVLKKVETEYLTDYRLLSFEKDIVAEPHEADKRERATLRKRKAL